MKAHLLLAGSLALSSCGSQSKQATAAAPEEPIKTGPVEPVKQVSWQQLPDGSQFYVDGGDPNVMSASIEGGDVTVERCWQESGGYDCLLLSKGDGSSTWFAERQQRPKLQPGELSYAGYGCSVDTNQYFDIKYQEGISRGGRELLNNMSSPREPVRVGWTRDFVEKFMAENNVQRPKSWFNCAGLHKIIMSGSGETLGTTAARRDQVFSS